jgi:penicillin-binding protein 2
MSIGQGAVLSTPLQLLNATAAIANGGRLYQPHLVRQITDTEGNVVETFEPELIRQLPVEPQHIDLVREGMWGAVNYPNGTAKDLAVPGIEVAAKTGTAEFFDPEIGFKSNNRLPTHAWFTAFAPYENPEIVVAVFIYNGGEGSVAALPVAQEILRGYFGTQESSEEMIPEPEAPLDESAPAEQELMPPVDRTQIPNEAR